MNTFQMILEIISANAITRFFCAVIIGWFVFALGFKLFFGKRAFSTKFVEITPNALAMLGVLGTFTGILIGLLDFDVNSVDESVPALLEGLKIAFITSICGITFTIFFRLALAIWPDRHASQSTTPEEIHAVLEDIRKALSSDGDSNLLTQIQKLRTTVQDGQGELIKEFREFAKHMVKNNQKALIEALEEVIRDFNQKLTEQFGENFKQLNEAVHKLVEWQDKYRKHVETLESRIDVAVSAIEASQKALEKVSEHSEHIPKMIEPLKPVLSGINAQIDVLDEHLKVLGDLRDKAIEAFPVIEQNLEKVTSQLANNIDEAISKSHEMLAHQKENFESLQQGHRDLLENANKARDTFSAELKSALDEMNKQMAQEFEKHGELIEESAKSAKAAIDESWSDNVKKLNAQFEQFDAQMQEQLKRSLELLGQNLASLSEKFVADYTPLTQRLQEVVEIAEKIDRNK